MLPYLAKSPEILMTSGITFWMFVVLVML